MDKRKVEFINKYITRCDAVENQVQAEKLQQEIIGVFLSDIPNLTDGLDRNRFRPNEADYIKNVKILKQKLKYYILCGDCEIENTQETKGEGSSVVVNVDNRSVNTQNMINTVQISIGSVMEQIDALPEHIITSEEKNALYGLLSRVESAPDKPSRWEKIKNALKWIADKGIEVGIAALPYIVDALKR